MSQKETIEYNGFIYTRYPDSNRRDSSHYFVSYKAKIKGKYYGLHQQIWADCHGEIPEGYHIHHIDGDPRNNIISNLECLSPKEHVRIHKSGRCTDKQRTHLDNIRHIPRERYKSEEDREWQEQRRLETTSEPKICKMCGKQHENKKFKHFCNSKCYSKHRRLTGVDNVTRTCIECGKEFTTRKDSVAKCCSRSCVAHRRHKLQ